MSGEIERASWTAPPVEEHGEEQRFESFLDGNDAEVVKVRMVFHQDRHWEMVDFAVLQRTRESGKWYDVALADSAHDNEVHIHRYGRRSAGTDVGDREHLCEIACAADLANGYIMAYDRIIGSWVDNKRRWRNA